MSWLQAEGCPLEGAEVKNLRKDWGGPQNQAPPVSDLSTTTKRIKGTYIGQTS